jgi:ATP-dependent DNA ligase
VTRAPASWPKLDLPLRPPLDPMEARLADALPAGPLLFEPKWDGFRCLAFRDGATVALQSKAGQPLGRYFPEIVEALRNLPVSRFVLDGEIVIPAGEGFSFDALLQRIHPAESRIRLLARTTPGLFLVFDTLLDGDRSLLEEPLRNRRALLERLGKQAFHDRVQLSPATTDRATAERWLASREGERTDGVMAKRLDAPYRSGERDAMTKVKRQRTADCVVGGFRWLQAGGEIGSLLLGLYDDAGLLNHVARASPPTSAGS